MTDFDRGWWVREARRNGVKLAHREAGENTPFTKTLREYAAEALEQPWHHSGYWYYSTRCLQLYRLNPTSGE